MLELNYRSICFSASLAALAACSGSPPTNPPTAGGFKLVIPSGVNSTRPDRSQSWISSEAVAASLLYVSDLGSFDVRVYTFPGLKLVGKLTGFSEPQGECSDAGGDIWITNTNTRQLLEFKHAGKGPIKTLNDPTGYPAGCAFDRTGDLAVTNLFDVSGSGSVLIYRHAAGTPRSYSNPSQFYNYFAGYNSAGDLYVSGQTAGNLYHLSVLRKGATSMSSILITGGSIDFPGTVQWIGTTLVLGDQKCHDSKSSCLYETAVSGKTVKIRHVVPLTDACDVAQVRILKSMIVGGDYQHCGHGLSSTDIWSFPAGGRPIKRAGGVEAPVGAAISVP